MHQDFVIRHTKINGGLALVVLHYLSAKSQKLDLVIIVSIRPSKFRVLLSIPYTGGDIATDASFFDSSFSLRRSRCFRSIAVIIKLI